MNISRGAKTPIRTAASRKSSPIISAGVLFCPLGKRTSQVYAYKHRSLLLANNFTILYIHEGLARQIRTLPKRGQWVTFLGGRLPGHANSGSALERVEHLPKLPGWGVRGSQGLHFYEQRVIQPSRERRSFEGKPTSRDESRNFSRVHASPCGNPQESSGLSAKIRT
jgi:hypothetical protein